MALTVNSGANLSTLFSSLGTNSSTESSMLLSDYASLKNGSYFKVAKAYYSKSKGIDKSEIDADSVKTDKQIAANAKSLSTAASSIYSDKSLFSKVTKEDKDGKEVTDYDYDAIAKKVKAFADSYNSTIKKAVNSETTGVISSTYNMVKSTAANSSLLSSVGISVGEDNTLSVNSDKLKSASIANLKSLFQGVGSYAYNVSTSASMIGARADSAANTASLYSAQGSYESLANTGNLMNAFL